MTFARLVRLDENLEIQPDLLDGGTTIRAFVSIRFQSSRESKFSDGTPIEAKDVIYSFHRWARKESLDNNLLDTIVGVKEYRDGYAKRISWNTRHR